MGIWDPIRFVTEDGTTIYKMFINGEWVESENKETFEVLNPANNELVARVQKATINDCEKALNAAFNAKKTMEDLEAYKRAEILEKISELILENKDDLVDTIVSETGKPIKLAEGEVKATAERYKYAASEAILLLRGEFIEGSMSPHKVGMLGMVVRKPMGVLLAISPFNYPLFIASAKVAPAIAAGNSVILKPASANPIIAIKLARIIELAGIPKGAFNLITGGGKDVGDYLVKSEKVDMISFTGSSQVGKHIASTAGMKKLHLELGGKTPALVLKDADLDLAAKECVKGALKFSGQRCDAVSRILVEREVADEFVKKVLEEVKKWKMGDPRDPKTSVGPLINRWAIEKVDSLVKDAISKGAKLLMGGKYTNLYYEPTVLDGITEEMRIAWEETFGPVIAIMRVNSYEEALDIANRSEYALDGCVFTKDMNKALDAALRLECGSVTINAAPSHGLGLFPFGGDEESGMGREGIKESILEMTRLHTIVLRKR